MQLKSLLESLQEREEFDALCEAVTTSSTKAHSVSKCVQDAPKNKRGEFWRIALQSVREYSLENRKGFSLACVLAHAWLDENKDSKDAIPPAALVDLVSEVHDALFELHNNVDIQNEVAELCERWYEESRPGRERIIAQLVPTIILRSLQPDGNPSRAYNLRETLLMFDLEDESSLALKKLLLQCFVSPSYLTSNHGRKFLAFALGLSEELMLAAHHSMRNQLLQMKTMKSDKRNTAISNFARIYYSAWQGLRREQQKEDDDANEKRSELLAVFEREIIQQDFMRGSVFLSDEMLAKTSLKVLNAAFHDNKKDRAVDSMLARLYEPVIWRGLGAVNATVRRNAAVVLFNAFPLHDPESRLEEISQSLQKQFEAIGELLSDPCGEVRATAVEGTCRILALFWETIPVQRSSKFLQQIVNELAHDRTSPNVRSAVVRSLAYMLDYPLAQPALKLALPHLKRHLNDKSSQVRLEMAKLLLKVDSTAGFKFTDVCSVNSVLLRLVEDKNLSQIASTLTELLAPSFYPTDVPSVEQLKRAKSLALSNFGASQTFFGHIHKFVDVNKAIKLALLFGSFVRARMKEVLEEEVSEDETNSAVEEIRTAIESICALWEPVAKQISKSEEAAEARQALRDRLSADTFLLPLFEWTPFAEKHESSLLRLCMLITSQTKMNNAGEVQAGGLERRILRQIFLSPGHVGSELEKKVTLAVKWGMTDRVLKEMVRSLTIHVNRERDVKRKVDARSAVRSLNQLIVANAINTIKTLDDKQKPAAGEEGQKAEEEALIAEEMNELAIIGSNEPLQALFDVARSSVSCGVDIGEVDEITACLSVIEMKLDLYLSINQKAGRTPRVLKQALEWAANRIDLLCALSNEAGIPEVLKRRKTGEDKLQLSHDGEEEEEDNEVINNDAKTATSSTNKPIIGGMLQAIIHLAADALFFGCDLVDASLFFLASASSNSNLDSMLANGLTRMILALKSHQPANENVNEVIRLIYQAAKDRDGLDQMFQLLMQKSDAKFNILDSILLRLFCEGENRLFSKRPGACVKALSLTLDRLLADDQSDNLFVLADYFARAAGSLKADEVRKELMKASKQAKGKLLGDRLFNLACELDDDA